MKFYTGIGSRETPQKILEVMTQLGLELAANNWTLRSGGAEGADTAFESGCNEAASEMCFNANPNSGIDCGICPLTKCGFAKKEIYIPWPGFQGRRYGCIYPVDEEGWVEAMNLAERFHPAWNRCSQGARKLHARNGFQVLGLDLKTPSKFIVCWTPGGKGGGGTGQAIRIARSWSIPIYDLAKPFKLPDLLQELLHVN